MPWPRLVAGAVAGAFAAPAAAWALLPGSAPGTLGAYPGAGRDAALQVCAFAVMAGAGVFLLPLFDPRVRRHGPAPRPSRVLPAGLLGALVLLVLEAVLGPDRRTLGLGTLAAGSAAALVLALAGLLLTAAGRHRAGAAWGGAGIALWAAAALLWLAAGKPWFP